MLHVLELQVHVLHLLHLLQLLELVLQERRRLVGRRLLWLMVLLWLW